MTTEINWRQNCLTVGPHDGRPEALWTMPLGYAKLIYGQDVLKDLVVSRVYNDAMQMVEHGDAPRMPTIWADQTKEYAENWFPRILRQKLVELDQYYTLPNREHAIEGVVERVKANKLNPHYQPLHSHDSINMLCRILGSQASLEARKDVT